MTTSLFFCLQKEHVVLGDKLPRAWTAQNYVHMAWISILPTKNVPSLSWKSMSTAAVSNTSSVTVVVLDACHMEMTWSHMAQAAEQCTAMALSVCATNISAASSEWINLIKGPGKSPGKGPAKGPVKGPVMRHQAMFWNDCNQIGSGSVRLRAVPLSSYFVDWEAKDVKEVLAAQKLGYERGLSLLRVFCF